ncbi:YadA-like family protein [Morganella psychrotolerans]|uniref:YadA-like family protein n=1 Tax=Morganella psychrotolerans TaxID=368603 RepID=UPI0039B01BB6
MKLIKYSTLIGLFVSSCYTGNTLADSPYDITHKSPVFGTTAVKYHSFSDSHHYQKSVISGASATSQGDYTVAVGNNAKSEKHHTVSLGAYSRAAGEDSVALGYGAYTDRSRTVSIGNSYIKKQLINVADGTEDNDAVNVLQLNQKGKSIQENINTSKNDAINTSTHYTNNQVNESTKKNDQQFQKIKTQFAKNEQRIDTFEKRVNAGLAGVTAISSIPYVTANNFSFGIGVGNYKNGNAIAAGAQYKPFENTNIRINTSLDNDNNSVVGAGLAIGW